MDLSTEICGIKWKNPVTVSSGTFGSGMEYEKLTDINALGAITTKGVSIVPWDGNNTIRVAETPSGMLNAIGLQNPGIDVFLKRDIEFLKGFDTNIIVNVCGHETNEYVEAVKRLSEVEEISMLEINISCPNVKAGGLTFGTDEKEVYNITRAVKKVSKKPIIMKLTPNVTSIKKIARAAEDGGADALSLINTLTGMKIDIEKQDFVLSNKTGGLSGPAIHPVAVRCVYEVTREVEIPVIGMGGIFDERDAIELLLAGASAVSVGTANFFDPEVTLKIIKGIEDYMIRKNINKVSDIKEILK